MEIQIAIIGAVGTVFGIIISWLTFSRSRDKDVRSEAADSAVIRTKLDNISSGIDSIRIDIKANEKRVSELSEKVIRIDESTKQAHKRINEIINIKGEI